MKTTKKSRLEARQLFRACLANGLLDENRVRQAVREVIAQKPRGYVAILSQFQRLVKLEVARRAARVESVVTLSDSIRDGIRANLARLYGQGLDITFLQNPALIGGLRIRVGSDVFDGSIQTRLARLEESL